MALSRSRALIALGFVAASILPSGATATVPKNGWMPASFGMLPACGKYSPDGYLYSGCLITRRIRFDPLVPGRMFAGTLYNGPWVSMNGVSWAPLVPSCQTNLQTARNVDPSGLTVCGVDDVAFDPLNVNTIYASTYSFSNPSLIGYNIEGGGIFKSTDGGHTWANVSRGLPPLRGAALAVIHQAGKPVTIIAGQIQAADHDVGTNYSIAMSYDDGATWKRVKFKPPKKCDANVPATSANLVATLTVNPANPDMIYAGSNAGLYQTTDRGRTWSLAFTACVPKLIGLTWGVAVTPDGSTIYSGSWDGIIRVASTRRLSPASWRTVCTLAGNTITDLMIDKRDLNNRTLFAAALGKGSAAGREAAGVYKLAVGQKCTGLFLDSTLDLVNHEAGAIPNLLPYPLVKNGPAFWLEQNPVAPDIIYLSQSQGGIFFRSDGEPLPKAP